MGEERIFFVLTFLFGIVVWDLDNIWVGKWDTPTPAFRSLKVNNNKEVLVKNVCIFALQDQYPEVTHGKKYLCSGGIHEVSLFFVLMDMP